MKLVLKWVVSVSLVLASSLGFASQKVGNGGYVVVCDGGTPAMTIELLDYLDGKYRFPSLGELALLGSENPNDIAIDVFKRLEEFDPERSEKYIKEVKEFDSQLIFVPDNRDLPNANNDFGTEMTENNCIIEQVAANSKPSQVEEKRYWIKESIWKKLTPKHQAGLIIHEIIYNDAIKRGHTNSEKARHLTFLFSSEGFEGLSLEGYREKMIHNYMSEYSALFKAMAFNNGKLRYFDGFKLPYAEAVKFCEKLPGVSRLASSDFSMPYYSSGSIFYTAVGKAIIGQDGLGDETIWLSDNDSMSLKINAKLSGIVEHSEGPHSFICVVNTATEP